MVSSLVATARINGLELHRLLVVQERGSKSKQVAVDPVGCKPGDWVIACGSSAAREAAGHKDYPSDLTIVGIIDYWDDENPAAEAPPPPQAAPTPATTPDPPPAVSRRTRSTGAKATAQ